MAGSLTQTKRGTSSGSNPLAVSFDSTPAAATMVEVLVGYRQDGTGGRTIAASDNQGNTYAVRVNPPSTAAFVRTATILSAYNVSSSGTFTVTITPSGTLSGNFFVEIREWAGLETSNTLDATATGMNTNAAPTTASSGTLSQADEVASCVLMRSGSNTTTAGSGWTETADEGSASFEHRVLAATTAIVGDWALGGSETWAVCLATYKAAAGGGGGRTTRNTRSHPLGVGAGINFRVGGRAMGPNLILPDKRLWLPDHYKRAA